MIEDFLIKKFSPLYLLRMGRVQILEYIDSVSIYRVSGNNHQILDEQVEKTKLSWKVPYHFVNFSNS